MTNQPEYVNERWFGLLLTAVKSFGVVQVAKQLGYHNHSSTSQVLSGSYAASTAKFAERVLAKLDQIGCPHLNRQICIDDCRSYALQAVPTSSTAATAHWRACQRCPNRPEE